MAEVLLTKDGKKQLEERLDDLKNKKRKEVAERIKEAREFGDISENAEYDAAKEEQAKVEGEINEIEAKLRLATIIDDVDTSVVSVGCTVTLRDDMDNEKVLTIVGTAEADPFKGRISNESPVGKGLMGHKTGARVEIAVPSGKQIYKIIKIKNEQK